MTDLKERAQRLRRLKLPEVSTNDLLAADEEISDLVFLDERFERSSLMGVRSSIANELKRRKARADEFAEYVRKCQKVRLRYQKSLELHMMFGSLNSYIEELDHHSDAKDDIDDAQAVMFEIENLLEGRRRWAEANRG